jgi:hypothetical protein
MKYARAPLSQPLSREGREEIGSFPLPSRERD